MITVLYVVTEDWYFWSHRVDLARAALRAGYRVLLATRFTAHRPRIEALGIRCIDLPFERSLRHPRRDLTLLSALSALIGREQPTLVHLVALKPILLGALALHRHRGRHFVLALTGMGYLFASQDGMARGIRWVMRPLLRHLLTRPNAHVLVQNDDDLALVKALGVDVLQQASVIRGSGVDLLRYCPVESPTTDRPIVLLAARMLRDKGIAEFMSAAPLVRARHPAVRFVLVGGVDTDNPAAIARDELQSSARTAGVEWWGAREDMPDIYRQAALVCLPSYREGLPKVLLEAAACGRPLVATDVPGCREICRPEVSGVLVPARNSTALADAIADLLSQPERMAFLGRGARQLIEREFAVDIVQRQTLALYSRLVGADVVGNS